MSDTDAVGMNDAADADRSMAFSRWLRDQLAQPGRSVKWLADADAGLSEPAIYSLLNSPRKGFPSPEGIAHIASRLGLPDWAVYGEAAYAVNLSRPGSGPEVSTFAHMLPSWVDRLPVKDQVTARDVILRLGEARGLTD